MLKGFNKKHKGQSAEKIAKHFLEKQGLAFIESNFNCKYGEIDLVFKDEQVIVFVEVRYRKNNKFGSAIETVNWHKQQKIVKAARYYLYEKQLLESTPCRLDIIGIEPKATRENHTTDYAINWIENAFNEFT